MEERGRRFDEEVIHFSGEGKVVSVNKIDMLDKRRHIGGLRKKEGMSL